MPEENADRQLDVRDILSLEFYKKSPFFGSHRGVRFKIEKSEDNLKCTTWPEPYSFEATDPSLMTYYESTFDDDGLSDITNHINRQIFILRYNNIVVFTFPSDRFFKAICYR